MKKRFALVLWVLVVSLALEGCNSSRIACPDVSGKKKFSLLGLGKKSEPTPEDQANEGRDLGGRDMDFNKKGLLTKKKTFIPVPKRKRSLLERVGLK
ncbi:hypothetical protein [Rufibacter radiotolerans]|nr:hypothetical protein [Rufibacter radiotolerans]